jgi:hypothetical protein
MGFLFLLVPILIAVAPLPGPSATVLMDFSRMAKAIDREIALVDKDGAVREGRLVSATADQVTMDFGGTRRVFAKTEIASAERLRDGVTDGIVRGVLFGLFMGALATQGCTSSMSNCTRDAVLGAMAVYGAIGWALDASEANRQPIYRSASAPPKANPGFDAFGRKLTLSFRF